METLQSDSVEQTSTSLSGARTVSHVTGIGLHTRLYTSGVTPTGGDSTSNLGGVVNVLAEGELRETQLRLLRFVWIELNRLCVELGSFPVFSSLLPQLSLQELKNSLRFIREAGLKFVQAVDARLISEMQDPQKKKKYVEFQRDFLSFREVRKALLGFVDTKDISANERFHSEWKILNNYSDVTYRLVQMNELLDLLAKSKKLKKPDILNSDAVDAHCLQGKLFREKLESVISFFNLLEVNYNSPKVQNKADAWQFFHFIHCLQTTPKRILQNRVVSVLNLNEKIRIDIWKDRAKPIVEQKVRLSKHFKLQTSMKVEELEKLADQISGLSFLDRFKSHYSEIMHRYEVLLVDEDAKEFKRLLSLSHFEKAQALREWSQWLRSSQSFSQNVEARSIFGALFKGIDTDFELAKDLYHWGQTMQLELTDTQNSNTGMGEDLKRYLFHASFGSIEALLTQNLTDVEEVLDSLIIDEAQSFDDTLVSLNEEEKILVRLSELLTQLDFKDSLMVGEVSNIKVLVEDLQFLFVRIYQNSGVFKAKLDQAFAETLEKSETSETALLDQLRVALEYVHWLENSLLPEELKRIFSFGNGYSKLMETVSRADFFLHLLRKVENQIELFLQASSQRGGKVNEVFEKRPAQVLLSEMQELLQIR